MRNPARFAAGMNHTPPPRKGARRPGANKRRTQVGWANRTAWGPGLPGRVGPHPDGEEHWAFRKLVPVTPPAVRGAARVRTAIDRFIEARLEARGLTLGPEADPRTLIRRVAFDLTGLPPTL